MRKQIFVCGIALCLALYMTGCGKSSEEKQAANYYQKELGLDKDEAEELAHEIYGKDEEEPSVTEAPKEIVVEPLPELVDSEWWERKVQIYDMVFSNNYCTTEEDIRQIVEGSSCEAELEESFDKNGDVYLDLKVDGIMAARFKKMNFSDNFLKYGLVDDGDYYSISYGNFVGLPHGVWHDKASIDFENLKTRDDVLDYLAKNGFIEVESTQSPYYNRSGGNIYPDITSVELADIPHYVSVSEEYITAYRIHKVSETDQEIERRDTFPWVLYSGAHLNLVNVVKFSFNPNGYIGYKPYQLEIYSYSIMGERTGEKFDVHP